MTYISQPDIVLDLDPELTRLSWRFGHLLETKGQAHSLILFFEQTIPRQEKNHVLLYLSNSNKALPSQKYIEEYGTLSPDYLSSSIIPRTINSLDYGISLLSQMLPNGFNQQEFDVTLYGICRSYEGLSSLRSDLINEVTEMTGNDTRYGGSSLRYTFFTHRPTLGLDNQVSSYLEQSKLNQLIYAFSIRSPINGADESPLQ